MQPDDESQETEGDADAPGESGPPTPPTQVEPTICALCDIVNDTFVAPRAFVMDWRLEEEGE